MGVGPVRRHDQHGRRLADRVRRVRRGHPRGQTVVARPLQREQEARSVPGGQQPAVGRQTLQVRAAGEKFLGIKSFPETGPSRRRENPFRFNARLIIIIIFYFFFNTEILV